MKLRVALLSAIASAGLLAQPADARPRDRQDQPPPQRQERRAYDRLDRSAVAARQAQAANGGGRVLSVEPEGAGYRVKVLKDGEVRTHHVEGN